MLLNIKCTNKNGESMQFDRRLFKLMNGLDLSGIGAEVNTTESTSDGSIYQNTRLKSGDFDLEFRIVRGAMNEVQMDEMRARIYRVFNPKMNPIKIEFENSSGDAFYIMAELAATPTMPPDKANNNAAYQKGLLQFITTDPFVYSAYDSVVEIATWVPNFEFPLEIPEDGIEMGYREPSLIKNVVNDGSDEIGMIVEFRATAQLNNPALINVNTYKQLRLNVTMQAGDVIRVNTKKRQRSITLIRNNIETDYFSKLDYLTSSFIQLQPGDNLLRYDADSGIDYLEVRVIYRQQFVGV